MPAAKPLPPRSRLCELLEYDAETGILTRWSDAVVADVAQRQPDGSIRLTVRVDGVSYLASRVVWFMHYGEDPGELFIDHINGDPSDDRACNLRLASHAENMRNARCRSHNSLGIKGVARCRGRYRAVITHNGVRMRLGVYDTPEQAHEAYVEAAQKYHGKFARAA